MCDNSFVFSQYLQSPNIVRGYVAPPPVLGCRAGSQPMTLAAVSVESWSSPCFVSEPFCNFRGGSNAECNVAVVRSRDGSDVHDTDRESSASFDRQASAMNSVSFLGLLPPKVHKTVSFFVSFHRGATRS